MAGISRRSMLHRSSMLTAFAATGLFAFGRSLPVLNIGACDWSLGKSSDPGSFELAKRIGLSGVQVNLGGEKDGLHLRRPEVQNMFIAASKEASVPISSIAIAELNNVPYKSDPRTEEWVSDAVEVATALNVKVILLAFFNKNDLRNDIAGKTRL